MAASLLLALFMVSLAGIPPTVGFWGKFYLFTAVINAHLTWLAVVAVLMSAVSAYYYLRVVWYLYFREARGRRRGASMSRACRSSASGGHWAWWPPACWLVGLFPQPLLQAGRRAAMHVVLGV